MGLKEELMNDFKEAMKAHDEVRKNTISLARAAIKQHEIDEREELDDNGVVAILQKQIKCARMPSLILKRPEGAIWQRHITKRSRF